jgi:hypothetical protein
MSDQCTHANFYKKKSRFLSPFEKGVEKMLRPYLIINKMQKKSSP